MHRRIRRIYGVAKIRRFRRAALLFTFIVHVLGSKQTPQALNPIFTEDLDRYATDS
jgi:hypothetical protein